MESDVIETRCLSLKTAWKRTMFSWESVWRVQISMDAVFSKEANLPQYGVQRINGDFM
jgi:hypothetical protein